MLQALLADRFALKVHEETRMLPIYALVVSKGGPKFQPSQKDGTTISSNGNNGNVKMTLQGSDHTRRLLAGQLEPDKGPVTILVVDQLGPPSEN